ncbi:MAG: orotidine-5'-phosphate decarboxylase [bacterium]|nr:orotidine-5'-phosphate decarboxylase [bacterium]
MKLSAKDRIIFPLDVLTLKEAKYYINLLKDYVGVFKVGLELFVSVGPQILREIKSEESGVNIFLDLKFHDIPATVRGAYRAASIHGAKFITVHCDEGKGLLEAVVKGREDRTAKILGVTLLTSLNKDNLKEMGFSPELTPQDIVMLRANMAKAAGYDGVVCSGLEAHAVKEKFGPDFMVVTPGIRPAWGVIKGDDQQRSVTPTEAIRNGADYIVVGRPVRLAKDPVKAAQEIAEEIEEALNY